MKIAIVCPLDTPITKNAFGGTEIWNYVYAEKLFAEGHKVTIFASEGSEFSGKIIEVVQRKQVEVPADVLTLSKEEQVAYSINQLLTVLEREEQFDVIHISNCNFYFYLPLLRLFKKPIVLTVHSYNFSGLEAGNLFNSFPVPTYVFNAESFKKVWPVPQKYQVIYPGINLADFEYNKQPDDYIFWMGRIHPDKGIEDAIKFAQKVNKKVIIAGPIRKEEYFNREVKPFLSDKIRYIGELNHEKKVKYYKNAKAFLVTTKRDESFGLVAAEAMACGTPVLAYDRGALPEIIEDGVTGFIIEPNNIEQLIERSKQLGQLNRQKCRERIKKKFNIEIMVEKYIELYQKLLEDK